MKTGDKLKVLGSDQIKQAYVKPGSICEFIKNFDVYACVLFEGREFLINKALLTPANQD